jgi:hypothetical protein
MPGNVGVSGGFSAQAAPPPSQPGSGVFNVQQAASAAIATSTDGAPTYDALGLPSNLGQQHIHVGYLPPVYNHTVGHRIDRNGDQVDVANTTGGAADQTVTVDDLLNHFADQAKSPNMYSRQLWAQVQQQLQSSNFYGSSARINYGAWGPDDSAALKKAANAYLQGTDSGKLQTFEEYLTQAAQQGAANGLDQNQPGGPGQGSQRAPLSLTNTADLNQAGDNVSQQFLGHAQSAGQQTDFADSYHGQEQAAYDAAGQANGAAYEQPATAADAARAYVLQNNMPEYAQHQAESYMNVFANMFISGTSARANTSLGDAAVGVK